jgi:lipoprotein-releasing system ATP-binding protein
MLVAKGIHKNYGTLHVLKGVDLQLEPGEVVALVGASGAGKSTLLQIVGTLDTADKGSVEFDGQVISSLPSTQKAAFRNRSLGFVFQFHHLLPEFTALENVAIPGYIRGAAKRAVDEQAKQLLTQMGLADRMHHKPSQLSGGEQQRVAVARALINQPRLILADEPTGNLDSQNSEMLFNLFFQLARDLKVAFLITTHNEQLAANAHRRLRMKDGIILS